MYMLIPCKPATNYLCISMRMIHVLSAAGDACLMAHNVFEYHLHPEK
jgi:hypothetical protein